MKRNIFVVTAFLGALFVFASFELQNQYAEEIEDKVEVEDDFLEESVLNMLEKLGDDSNPHPLNTKMKSASAKAGEDIIRYGFVRKKGQKAGKLQSKHFVCTSCHNLVKEDPDLSVSIPEDRLEYALENDLPFLQGTTLYGAVNRTSFYNDDYYKKYGELVYGARDNIRKAIQLCATECAQGRALKNWEIESILSYLYTIDLKLHDLDFNGVELDYLRKAAEGNGDNEEAIKLVKSKYLTGSPATFLDPPADRKKPEFDNPNLAEGKMIYEKSCLYCHENQRYSYFLLEDDEMSFKHLSKKAGGYGRHSIYQVTRYGVPSYQGKKSYMPHYTAERLSDSQLSNLRAYIDYKAKR